MPPTPSYLEEKIAEFEPRLKKLEDDYKRDIQTILTILKSLEKRVAGGGIEDTDEIGLIIEVRDLKKDIVTHKSQWEHIQATVDEIKTQLIPSQQIIKDVEAIKIKLEGYEKYKYIVWGIILAAGWALNKISPFIEQLLK